MNALLLALLVAGQTAPSGEPDLTGLGLGRIVDLTRRGGHGYAALESGGVAVIDLGDPARPKVVARIAEGRPIARVLVSGDALYLLEVRQEALAFSLADPGRPTPQGVLAEVRPAPVVAQPAARVEPTPAAAPSPPPAPAAAREVQVVEVLSGRAIFDGGREEGFTEGRHVRIVSQQLVEKPDLSTGGTRKVPSGEVTAVLRIEQTDAHRSMALLGRGDVVAPGDRVELTTEPLSERLFIPRRAPFTFRAGFHARPFLGLEARSKPVGMLLDLYGSWYLSAAPVALTASVSPLGLGIGTVDRHYPTTVAVTGAYTTDFFEIGLGAGALLGEDGPCRAIPLGPANCEENSGFTINQVLRLGALDGLHVSWNSSMFSRPDRFVFGMGRGELNVPLTSRLGLFGGGGGGENGWAFGEFGVRTYVGGTGSAGTLVVSASLGYASIFDGPSGEAVGGPSVAFGMEWRR